MQSVYVETSVISYLAAHTSREMIVAARQALGWEWWQMARDKYSLFVSQAVIDELQAGDQVQSKRRLELIEGLPVMQYSELVVELIDAYSRELGLTGTATADLPHFAFAVAGELDYLITWNCKHIANGNVIRRLVKLNSAAGRKTPVIGIPEILLAPETGNL